MKEWKLALFGMACATVGWGLGAYPPGGLDGTLARHRVHRRQMLEMCFENMKHQFTPGYKSYQTAFDYDETPRAALNMAQGEIFRTQTPTNLALQGAGFFVLEGGHYTRDGRFTWQDGCLRNTAGHAVLGATGPLHPGDYTHHHFDDYGQLYGEKTITDPVTGQTITQATPLGRVQIARFPNPELLSRRNVTEFVPTLESGPAQELLEAEICPASLELSNVDFFVEGASIGRLKGSSPALLPQQPAPLPPPMPPTIGILGSGCRLAPGADPMALPSPSTLHP